MKIILHNFKIHEDNSYDINDDGVTLIYGESGKGKTSILNAIYFCLYGDVKRPVRFGENECHVHITHDVSYEGKMVTLIIKRNKKPDRLRLKLIPGVREPISKGKAKPSVTKYEDDEAQEIINRVYGAKKEFQTACYISQKMLGSLLYQGPTEQRETIETLAFKDINITKFKDRINKWSAKRKEQLENVELNLSNLKEKEQEKSSAIKAVNKPPKYDEITGGKYNLTVLRKMMSDFSNSREKIDEIQAKIRDRDSQAEILSRNLQESMERARERDKCFELISRQELLLRQVKEKKEELSRWCYLDRDESNFVTILANVENNISGTLSLKDTVGEIVSAENNMAEIRAVESSFSKADEIRLEEMKAKFQELSKTGHLHDELKREVTFHESVETYHKRLEAITPDPSQYLESRKKLMTELTDNISELDEKIKMGVIYTCPSCNSSLYIKGQALMRADNSIQSHDLELPCVLEPGNSSHTFLIKQRNELSSRLSTCSKEVKTLESLLSNKPTRPTSLGTKYVEYLLPELRELLKKEVENKKEREFLSKSITEMSKKVNNAAVNEAIKKLEARIHSLKLKKETKITSCLVSGLPNWVKAEEKDSELTRDELNNMTASELEKIISRLNSQRSEIKKIGDDIDKLSSEIISNEKLEEARNRSKR
jgi:DNA repair exonuclease SbcCD ATPase subunit